MEIVSRPQFLERATHLLNTFPVLAILGPRQCGKTTLVREFLSGFEYLDLERPSDFQKLDLDPELYLTSRKVPCAFDEAQRYPALFPILRSVIDERRKRNGQFIILGSASVQLQKIIYESLSGRVAFLDLSPLLLRESISHKSLDVRWLKGGYPDALLVGSDNKLAIDWFDFYSRTHIEQDLPALGIDIDPILYRRLWTMCVHFHGQIPNMKKIAESLGVSPHTVSRYLHILESTFILRTLPPYHANLKKRLVKSPKLYFRDSGLLHYFAGIHSHEDLLTSPERGTSFEGLVVEEITQRLKLESSGWDTYHFRTSDQKEIDLVLVKGSTLIPIEIKSKQTISRDDKLKVLRAADIIGAKRAIIVYAGSESFPADSNLEVVAIRDLVSSDLSVMGVGAV